MATVIFYEKPGCTNNTKQKILLEAAGHRVEAHNLLTEAWTRAKLRPFFGNLPVAAWFNRSAPQVKSGEINPDSIEAETALALMVQNPLLIRRPLMQVGSRQEVGFDTQTVDAWIGLHCANEQQQPIRDTLIEQDLQTCPNSNKPDHKPCKVTPVEPPQSLPV